MPEFGGYFNATQYWVITRLTKESDMAAVAMEAAEAAAKIFL
jgi:hypothetical protein